MNRPIWRNAAKYVLVFVAAMICSLQGVAQQTLGSLNGTVVDTSGAAVGDAIVTITNTGTNYTASTKTQSTGFYQVFNLPVGDYSVKVSHPGFETTTLKGVPVQEARAITVNASLKVGQVTESVEVTSTPLLNATDTTNGYTLDSAQIDLTPLATGSFTQVAVLSPGVNAELLSNLDSNAGIGNQPIWANGQRDTSNTFQVNGADSTNLFNGKSSSGENSQRYNFNIGSSATVGGSFSVGTSVYGSNGNSLPSPPPEFIQELRVNASMYDAQQGATAGAQIDVNTNTGTNNWHGQVYGMYANNLMNSSPFFFNQAARLAQNGVGVFPSSLVNPWLRRWNTGFTAGGPLKTDRLFFFVAYQRGFNEDQGTAISELNVPVGLTDDRSDGALLSLDGSGPGGWNCVSSSSHTCATSIDPVASTIMNAKLPNGQFLIPSSQSSAEYDPNLPNAYLVGKSRLITDQLTASVDYDATKTDRVEAKYFLQNAPVTRPFDFRKPQVFQ